MLHLFVLIGLLGSVVSDPARGLGYNSLESFTTEGKKFLYPLEVLEVFAFEELDDFRGRFDTREKFIVALKEKSASLVDKLRAQSKLDNEKVAKLGDEAKEFYYKIEFVDDSMRFQLNDDSDEDKRYWLLAYLKQEHESLSAAAKGQFNQQFPYMFPAKIGYLTSLVHRK